MLHERDFEGVKRGRKKFKRCYKCNGSVPPFENRSMMVDKIIYTLCAECRKIIEGEDALILMHQHIEREDLFKRFERQKKAYLTELESLDNDRFTRLRIVLNQE